MREALIILMDLKSRAESCVLKKTKPLFRNTKVLSVFSLRTQHESLIVVVAILFITFCHYFIIFLRLFFPSRYEKSLFAFCKYCDEVSARSINSLPSMPSVLHIHRGAFDASR